MIFENTGYTVVGCLLAILVYIVVRFTQKVDEAKRIYGNDSELCKAGDYMWKLDGEYNYTIINGVIFAEEATLEDVQEMFLKAVNAEHYRKFKQRLIMFQRIPMWITDEDFDHKWHISKETHAVPTNDDELDLWLARQAVEALPIDRPMWQVKIVENYKTNADGKGETVVLFRCHHVIADGIALGTMLFNLLNNEKEAKKLLGGASLTSEMKLKADESSSKVNKQKVANPWLVNAYGLLMLLPIMGGLLLQRTDTNMFHVKPNRGVEGKRTVGRSGSYPLEKVKLIKTKLKMTVNDVLMGVLGAAINRTTTRLNKGPCPTEVKVVMPVNMRTGTGVPKMENDLTMPVIPIPTRSADPVATCKEMKVILDGIKKSVTPLVMYHAQTTMAAILPSFLTSFILDFVANKHTAVVSNGPGSQMYIGTKKVSNMVFWVPQRANMAMGFSIMTMGGKLTLGCILDTSLGPHADVLCEEYMKTLKDLESSVLN
ncbi:hypothetical protein SARC_03826 [Sphaeroforma arctica JP610]|uniref:Uncharacterized protein n=1 Tax=Sphaeroforma arctica JP610 TaxID=667725 RepID=A0A0L0G4A6_9EUKA|nr:hypothetical protein SARC_03826 [Sphaeroforma arctica JP610]KNC83932.1 hypothetical protein SARC_03826 [Sphaeroforma arctica JP610]|eukprot:XP_014157834.1 hypothetical protein SARC_03826 [Sphaeroforma arctica JP610]